MAFHFTEEDFKRYVTVDEHGGRHIWHELQERLKHEFGGSFSSTPYIARGDRLRTLWFAPTGTPRHKWDNQAQFFLARSIEKKQLSYGLMIECPTLSDVAEYGYDQDRDGARLVKLLEHDGHFNQLLNDLVRTQGFSLEVNVWDKGTHSPSDTAELLNVLKSLPPEQGWGTHIQQVLSASDAIASGEKIADQIMNAYRATRPLFEAVVSDSVGEYLTHSIALPQNEKLEKQGIRIKGLAAISSYFAAYGLHFTSEQLATFYTALKTKGFVILTGISGTGKTKLAQYFAELFPTPERAVTEEPEEAETVIRLQIQPYMLKYTRLIVPKGYWKLLDVPAAGETVEVELTFDGRSETCRLTHASYGATDYLQVLFRGKARRWLTANFSEDDIIILEPAFSDEGDFSGFHLREPEARQVRKREPNFYFASVRPDWKDSKSLLGYYNPLSEQFESTGFLRFILKAHQDPTVPYFVLLDEMNLAKVEYYFADFLSVLESGRREDGFTKEAIRFQYPEGIDGPPRELYLPPNLYFIGTVNVDETTYMFSPKVLDRAFTLELSEVDFAAYPSEQVDSLSQEELEALRAQLLPDFTNQGRFAIVDKSAVAGLVQQYPTYREHLTKLNALLQPHDLHFGYRVFDEIVMFLANAEGSPVFDGFGPDGLGAAFDSAVLMKVLPKFHGTRGRLGGPLEKIVGWAREPDNPEAGHQVLSDKLQDTEGIAGLREDLRRRIEGEESSAADAFAYPRTALKALRMLHDLYTTGFASFA